LLVTILETYLSPLWLLHLLHLLHLLGLLHLSLKKLQQQGAPAEE